MEKKSNQQEIAIYVRENGLVPLIDIKTRFIHMSTGAVISGAHILEFLKYDEDSEVEKKIVESLRCATREEIELSRYAWGEDDDEEDDEDEEEEEEEEEEDDDDDDDAKSELKPGVEAKEVL